MNRETARRLATELVSRMTVEEAAEQLRYDAPENARLGIPAYNWWNEALHGVARAGSATSFPQAIGIGATFDKKLVKALGEIVAEEGRAKYNAAAAHGDRSIYKGLTFWSPNINIFRDPRWGRGHETYGEDPFLTGEMGLNYVEGIQGNGKYMKAAACAKHFAVHSGPEGMRHSFNAVVSQKDLNETYLPAFKKLVTKAKVEAVMGAYNRTNDEPCCGSHTLMTETLRGKWGFEGHFTSDCWAIRDFHEHHMVTASPEESAALALKEGCDVNCGNTYVYMMKAYEKGLVTEEMIRTAAIRLFTTRYLLGIMGDKTEYDDIPYTVVECDKHLDKAKEATEKSCVLLKNNGVLPLDLSKIKTLGIIGPNANSRRALVGNYHGTSSRYITVLEGLQDALQGKARVMYSEGSDLFRPRIEGLGEPGDRLAEAQAIAECSDAVVLVVGLDETMEGEEGDTGNAAASGDKADLLLPQCQRSLMDAVLKVGKPTVICLMAGSSIDLGDANDRADGVLLTWYPGARGGKSVADILLGNVSPSGKLPLTFYKNEQLDRMPAFTDYSMENRTYRYFEEEPLYPFGFGLTYGNVSIRNIDVTEAGDHCHLEVSVENTSAISTDEVVQVYCKNEGSALAPKNPRLCAFERVSCPAWRTANVSMDINHEDFKVYNESGELVSDGKIVLYVGFGQPNAQTERLTGKKSFTIRL